MISKICEEFESVHGEKRKKKKQKYFKYSVEAFKYSSFKAIHNVHQNNSHEEGVGVRGSSKFISTIYRLILKGSYHFIDLTYMQPISFSSK